VVDDDDDLNRPPRGEVCGSQASVRGLTTTVIPEFRNVDNSLSTSSKRRPRGGVSGRPHGLEILSDTIQDDDHDELGYQAPGNRVLPGSRLPSSSSLVGGVYYDGPNAGGDASDFQFSAGRHIRNAQDERNKKRRIGARMYDNDPDELGDDLISVHKRAPTHQPGNGAASISRKADIPRTNWAGKPQVLDGQQGVPIVAAVCVKDLRYGASPNKGAGVQYFLRPDLDSNLHAFSADGNLPQGYRWIRITKQTTKHLQWNPACWLIKVAQTRDEKLGAGPVMVLRFQNAEDAAWVVKWTRTKLDKVGVSELERYAFFCETYLGCADLPQQHTYEHVRQSNGRCEQRDQQGP
jgi:hypothetical protein